MGITGGMGMKIEGNERYIKEDNHIWPESNGTNILH